MQHQPGYWWSDVINDIGIVADLVLLQFWLHREAEIAEWPEQSQRLVARTMITICAAQLNNGGFNLYPLGPAELNVTVKAYVALRIGGMESENPVLVSARAVILSLGGLEAANAVVKVELSVMGLYPRELTPTIASSGGHLCFPMMRAFSAGGIFT
jgi:squalene-hopene/tetraprenyl-beta-curcumene cyclase